MRDDLGNRMKSQYENRTRYYVPRRTYTIIRLDGKSFHTYTKGLKRPFDKDLQTDIDVAICMMMCEIQGAVFAYTQSDEISILLTDFAKPTTDAWFDGNIQKIASVSASIMTAEFNKLRILLALTHSTNFDDILEMQSAYFDSRVFTIPDPIEVMNYFRWRQKDCIRNSISMVAHSHFSHKELLNKSQNDIHEMLYQKEINWSKHFSTSEKNGRIITKDISEGSRWTSRGAWIFTEDEKLYDMIINP